MPKHHWAVTDGGNFQVKHRRNLVHFTSLLPQLRSSATWRPVLFAVSIALMSEWNLTPRARRSPSIVIRSRRLRPSRSSFHTINIARCVPFLQAAEKGRALRRGSPYSLVLENALASGLLQHGELQGGVLGSVETRA